MPSIRDLVGAIRQRDGVDAAVVLGRDGLLIDAQGAPGVDTEGLAALIPAIIASAEELGREILRGELNSVVLEHQAGLSIISVLNADAILVVLVRPDANVGPLLYEIRRNREHIASLV